MSDYKEIIAAYKDTPGGIIEAFHALQREFNYIPKKALKEAARLFNISEAEAYGVATFYSYFSLEERGKYIIRICRSAPCHISGADEVVKALEKYLDIKMGETTSDGKFTLEWTECVGQCDETPVITINSEPFKGVSPKKIPDILSRFQ